MITVLVVAMLMLLIAVIFRRLSQGGEDSVCDLGELTGRTQPVDLQAFRNLIDPLETAFLRKTLPRHAFRSIQRARVRAVAEYVGRIAENSAVLFRLGQTARENSDPELARVAQAIVDRALAVRIIAVRAMVQLKLKLMLPDLGYSPNDVFERYERLTDSVALFTRLQRPAYAARVAAAL